MHIATLNIKLLKNKSNGFNECCAEINPNKAFNNNLIMNDLKSLLSLSDAYWIEYMDIAIDIPVSKNFIHLIKDRRAKLDYYQSKDLSTEYLGKQRNKVGHVKLYDKQDESKLSYSLTRFEITVGNPLSQDWIYIVKKKLPIVLLNISDDKVSDFNIKLNDTEKVLVKLLIKDSDKISLWQQ